MECPLGVPLPASHVRMERRRPLGSHKASVFTQRIIRLLKPHGSLNWIISERPRPEIRLKQRLHQQRGTPHFTIIPPGWNKGIDGNDVFREIWREAAHRIRAADKIAVVGFSFVATDLHAQSLFRIALEDRKKTKLRRLIIVNPNHEARRRIRGIFEVSLAARRALVRQYDSFEEFVAALPMALA